MKHGKPAQTLTDARKARSKSTSKGRSKSTPTKLGHPRSKRHGRA